MLDVARLGSFYQQIQDRYADRIEPMRQAFGPIVAEDTKKADPRWSSQIQDKITRTSVALTERLVESLEVASCARMAAGSSA